MVPIASPVCTPKNVAIDASTWAISIDEKLSRRLAAGAIRASAESNDAQRRELRDQLVRELGPCPVVVDDRRDLLLGEVAHPAHQGATVLVEQVLVAVEVTPQERQDLLLAGARHENGPSVA